MVDAIGVGVGVIVGVGVGVGVAVGVGVGVAVGVGVGVGVAVGVGVGVGVGVAVGVGVGVGVDGGDVNEIVPLLPLYEYVPEQEVVLEQVPDAVPGDGQPVLAESVADHDPLESTEPLRIEPPASAENWPELSIVNTGPGTVVPTPCSSHVVLVIDVGV